MTYCCWGQWERPFSGVCGRSGQRGHASTTDGRWWSRTNRGFSQTSNTSFRLWSVSTGRDSFCESVIFKLGKYFCKHSAIRLCLWAITHTVLLSTEKLKCQGWWCSRTIWSHAAIESPRSVQHLWDQVDCQACIWCIQLSYSSSVHAAVQCSEVHLPINCT